MQEKRIHEYKRQHLNVLHIVALCHRLEQDPGLDTGRSSPAARPHPAADLSGQIATADKERPSGTDEVTLMVNGALTIGTLDGANVEMRDEVAPGTASCSG
jgi:glycogen phosphorylase